MSKTFADPYKRCSRCGAWADGFKPDGVTLVPCGHMSDYRDVCPTWSPVTGCGCLDWNARHPEMTPISHETRERLPSDDRPY